jgi:hypothetical protein
MKKLLEFRRHFGTDYKDNCVPVTRWKQVVITTETCFGDVLEIGPYNEGNCVSVICWKHRYNEGNCVSVTCCRQIVEGKYVSPMCWKHRYNEGSCVLAKCWKRIVKRGKLCFGDVFEEIVIRRESLIRLRVGNIVITRKSVYLPSSQKFMVPTGDLGSTLTFINSMSQPGYMQCNICLVFK